MTHTLLDYFLVTQLSAALLIFCRVGAAFVLLPGIGEMYVPARVRLTFALVLTILTTPLLEARMPPLPGAPLALFVMMSGEILVGIFIGMIARVMLSVIHVAGHVIALQSSLSVATLFDPNTGAQSATLSNFLSITALALMFVTNMHHLLIAVVFQSYDVFAPGLFPSVADMNLLNTRVAADSFALGVMLSAPHIVFSLLFYVAGGLMTRLMPSFQVFYVMVPLQLLIAFFLLIAILPNLMDIFAGFFEHQLLNFVTADGI